MPDDDLIFDGWMQGTDPEGATHRGQRMILEALSSTTLSIDVKIMLLLQAIEPLLDGPERDPMYVVYAAKLLAKEAAFVSRTTHVSGEQLLRRRVLTTVAQARALHCAWRSDEAFRLCLAALTPIQSLAEGRSGLLDRIANKPPNVCAECTLDVIGIMAASLRRASLPPKVLEFWTGELRELTMRYLGDLTDVTRVHIYPGTPSAIQVMYLLAPLRDPKDAALIRALHALNKIVRPTHRRAQATVPVRELVVADYEDDVEGRRAHNDHAMQNIIAFPLERHLEHVHRHERDGGPSDEAIAAAGA